jgi:exonuclease III
MGNWLKILTWNCNGAFRRKFDALLQFDADIIVIQECEDPERTSAIRSAFYFHDAPDTKIHRSLIFQEMNRRAYPHL